MPVNRDKLNQQIAQLEQYVKDLRSLGSEDKSSFTKDSAVEAAAERRVYKAVQSALDVGQIVISGYGFGVPAHYRDVFVKLGKNKVIIKELQSKLEKMAGMRNVLAHGYTEIDPDQIYQVVKKDYQDLVEFIEAVNRFIG